MTNDTSIIVVSGLPRSGTSMMMRMLEAGGVQVLSDGLRTADVDNPRGYYEYERVKGLDKGDVAWLPYAEGKAVKIISALLQHLPADYHYRVIFMQRDLAEVLSSQRKMLERRGEDKNKAGDDRLTAIFRKHLAAVGSWLRAQPNIAVLDVDYGAMIADPEPAIVAIALFLGRDLDRIAMRAAIEPALYRNRGG